jgi:hypothetical protein
LSRDAMCLVRSIWLRLSCNVGQTIGLRVCRSLWSGASSCTRSRCIYKHKPEPADCRDRRSYKQNDRFPSTAGRSRPVGAADHNQRWFAARLVKAVLDPDPPNAPRGQVVTNHLHTFSQPDAPAGIPQKAVPMVQSIGAVIGAYDLRCVVAGPVRNPGRLQGSKPPMASRAAVWSQLPVGRRHGSYR